MASTYTLANDGLEYMFGKRVDFLTTVPTSYWIGLATTATVPTRDGTGVTEVTGGSYARVEIVNDGTSWGTAASGSLVNSNQINFPESSASWGTVGYILLWNQAVGGTLLFYQALASNKTVQSGTTVVFTAGGITVTMA